MRSQTSRASAMKRRLMALALTLLTPLAFAQQPTKVYDLESGQTYGYAIADYNKDGLLDHLALGHDPDNEWLWFGQPDGSFRQGFKFLGRNELNGAIDRHGCAAADFNSDGRIDLFCAIGASRGTGRGNNELWLQAADGSFVRDNQSHGATDPFGRGRHPVAFRLNKGPVPDLILVNEGEPRADGRPNINRVYRNDGKGKFIEVQTIASVAMLTTCQAAGDVDADNFDDLVVCPRDGEATIYRNNRKNNFTIVPLPMSDKRWWTAEFARINGDNYDDLVVTTKSGFLQVFLSTGHPARPFQATPHWQAKLPPGQGVSVAIGDLDGDQQADLYVVLRAIVSFDGPDCPTGQDSVDDVVFMSKGLPPGQWSPVQLNQGYASCGYAAAFLGKRRIALSQGGTGWPGAQYILDWSTP